MFRPVFRPPSVSGVPMNFCAGGGYNKLNWGQRERGSGGGSPLVRSSTQCENEWNPYSDNVVTDLYSTELGIRLSFVKTSEFRGRVWTPKHPPPPRYWPLVNILTNLTFRWRQKISRPGKFWPDAWIPACIRCWSNCWIIVFVRDARISQKPLYLSNPNYVTYEPNKPE
jgi:hypothetical protein